MKVSVLQENLKEGLARVGKAVSSRSTLPILDNVLMVADEATLRLTATDLMIGITTNVGARVEMQGTLTVPARLLTEFVNSLPPERVDMEWNERTATLSVACGRFKSNIKGMGAQDFPALPVIAGERRLVLGADDLKSLFAKVAMATSTRGDRPVLTGIFLKVAGEHLTLSGADGFRMSLYEGENADGGANESVIIPARALLEVARLAGDTEEPVGVLLGKTAAKFVTENGDLTSQLIEGTYPDVLALVPQSHLTTAVMATAELQKAVKLAALFAKDSSDIVRLAIAASTETSPGEVTVSAVSAERGDEKGVVDAAVAGPSLTIAFNARYLSEFLDPVGSVQGAMEANTPEKPGVFKPFGQTDFLHVIMPMHVSG